MKYVAPDYEIYSVNEDGTINVKSEDLELDDENELRAKFNVSAKSDAPKIIIIDEISQFNSCELDLLQKFAERHGIAVIISGDTNQS
jgi:thymidine kinase